MEGEAGKKRKGSGTGCRGDRAEKIDLPRDQYILKRSVANDMQFPHRKNWGVNIYTEPSHPCYWLPIPGTYTYTLGYCKTVPTENRDGVEQSQHNWSDKCGPWEEWFFGDNLMLYVISWVIQNLVTYICDQPYQALLLHTIGKWMEGETGRWNGAMGTLKTSAISLCYFLWYLFCLVRIRVP